MNLITINDNHMGQNIYLYLNDSTNEGVIIDPGDSQGELQNALKNIKITAILLTHGHYDHITNAAMVKKLTNAPIYCHDDETQHLENPAYNLSIMTGEKISITPDVILFDEDVILIGDKGDVQLKIIHTPGHTPGGICFYDEKNEVLFTGDTLFNQSIGRTDFPLSQHDKLIESIKEKLFTLPDTTKVYPGHNESTTIGYEKENNPWMRPHAETKF